MTLRRVVWCAMIALLMVVATMIEGQAMDRQDLVWQGTAGRKPDRFVLVRIEDIAADRGGLFGIRQSPSIVGALPNAMVLQARAVVNGQAGNALQLRLPGGELPPLQAGDRAVLGLLGKNVCLCVLRPPSDLAEDTVTSWGVSQPCGR